MEGLARHFSSIYSEGARKKLLLFFFFSFVLGSQKEKEMGKKRIKRAFRKHKDFLLNLSCCEFQKRIKIYLDDF